MALHSSTSLPYLRLRLTLLARLARELGWWRLVVVAGLLLTLLLGLVRLGSYPAGRWALPLLGAATLLGAHQQRADLPFLALAAPRYRRWLALEYALLSVPLGLLLLALGALGPALLTPGLAAGVALLPAGRAPGPGRRPRRSLFRAEAFEWVSGARAPGAGLLWLGLLALTWGPGPLAGWGAALALLAWLLVVVSWYGTPEPEAMLLAALRQPGPFLRRRLALALGYGALTAAPLAAGLGSWRGALGAGLGWLGLLALAVLAKYAFYPVTSHLRWAQALLLAVALLGVASPAFPPLLLVIAAGLRWQSYRRLRSYLTLLPNAATHQPD